MGRNSQVGLLNWVQFKFAFIEVWKKEKKLVITLFLGLLLHCVFSSRVYECFWMTKS